MSTSTQNGYQLEQLRASVKTSEVYNYALQVVMLDYLNEPRFWEMVSKDRKGRKASPQSKKLAACVSQRPSYDTERQVLLKLDQELFAGSAVGRFATMHISQFFASPEYKEFRGTIKSSDARISQLMTLFVKVLSKEAVSIEVLEKNVFQFINIILNITPSNAQDIRDKLELYYPSGSSISNRPHLSKVPTFDINDMKCAHYLADLLGVAHADMQKHVNQIRGKITNLSYVKELIYTQNRMKDPVLTGQDLFESTTDLKNWLDFRKAEIENIVDSRNIIMSADIDSREKGMLKIIPNEAEIVFINLASRIFQRELVSSNKIALSGPARFFLFKLPRYWLIDYPSTILSALYSAFNLSFKIEPDLNLVYEFLNLLYKKNIDGHVKNRSEIVHWKLKDKILWLQNINHTLDFCFSHIGRLLENIYSDKKPKFSYILAIFRDFIESDDMYLDHRNKSAYDFHNRIKNLKEIIFVATETYYKKMLSAVPLDSTISYTHFLNMIQLIDKEIRLIQRKYPKPLFNSLNISFECASILIQCLFADVIPIITRISQFKDETTSSSYTTALEAYKKLKELQKIHVQVQPKHPINIDLESLFIGELIALVDDITSRFAVVIERLIQNETWKVVNEKSRYSRSVVDMLKISRDAFSLIKSYSWTNTYELAEIMTYLLNCFSKGVKLYCAHIKCALIHELKVDKYGDSLLQPDLNTQDTQYSKIGKWGNFHISRSSGKKNLHSSFGVFSDRACVMLNSIDELIVSMKGVEAVIDPAKLSIVDAERRGISKQKQALKLRKTNKKSQIITIRVLKAEGIRCPSNSDDPNLYVTINSSQAEKEIIRTKTISGTHYPEWDEETEITLEANCTPDLTVYCWHQYTDIFKRSVKNELCGRSTITMDKRDFDHNGIAKEIVCKLDPAGSVVLYVSFEIEKKDPVFIMGRIYRELHRTKTTMIELFVSKFDDLISDCLCRQTISIILKQSNTPSSHAIYDAIQPLLDTLNSTLNVLAQGLKPDILITLMLKVWYLILRTCDSMILPRLDIARTLGELNNEKNPLRIFFGHRNSVAGYGKPLTSQEQIIVLKWMELLCVDFFYNNGEGPPIRQLKNRQYNKITLCQDYYNMSVDELLRVYTELENQYLSFFENNDNWNGCADVTKGKAIERRKNIAGDATETARDELEAEIEDQENVCLSLYSDHMEVVLRVLITRGCSSQVHALLLRREQMETRISYERRSDSSVIS